jgi:hypothetical protein
MKKRPINEAEIDAILAELEPIFARIWESMKAAGWRKDKHGRRRSPDGATLAQFLRKQGVRT